MHEFELAGQSYRVKPLKLKAALKAEAILVEAVLPALLAAVSAKDHGLDVGAVRLAIAGLERLDSLVELYAQKCEVRRADAWVALGPFVDEIFERKTSALLAWIVAVTEYQFADFFDGSGQRLLVETASRLGSLLGSTGGSGD